MTFVQPEVARVTVASTPPVAFPLPVAPLDVPDRITKRDYNYFDELNAELAALRGRERTASAAEASGAAR